MAQSMVTRSGQTGFFWSQASRNVLAMTVVAAVAGLAGVTAAGAETPVHSVDEADAGQSKFGGRVPEGVKPEENRERADGELTGPQSPDLGQPHRFQLVRNGEDVLRIDRQSGKVGVCSKQNDVWRCSPVPLAEEAYEAEIVSLNGQIDALKQRIAELEAARGAGRGKQPDTGAPSAGPERPENGLGRPAEPAPPLSEEDEKELNKVLDFSEKAMRRFFGLMQDLRKEMEPEQPGR